MEPGKEYYNEERGVCAICGTNCAIPKLRKLTTEEMDIVKRWSLSINVSPITASYICLDVDYCAKQVKAKIEATKA